MTERLQKILARAGFGSRRSVETLIAAGRVRVNGDVARVGSQADAAEDRIEVDGAQISLPTTHAYLAVNKPSGYVTTARDPQQRHTVMELLPANIPSHVVPVGRLDRDTEGLLLFTSDGELAHRLAHPKYEIEKEYYALVDGAPALAALDRLREGIVIEGRRTRPAIADLSPPPYGYHQRIDHTWLRIVIHEGRKRQVRLMCAAIGHQVRTLVRTRIGSITLAKLARGDTRPLSDGEVAALRQQLSLDD